MYLHLGQSVVVPHKNILGIFDLDNSSWAFKTREFLERAEQEGRVVSVCDDLPPVLCAGGRGGGPAYGIHLPAVSLRPAAAHREQLV